MKLAVLSIAVMSIVLNTAMATEEAAYTVIEADGAFEIRIYEPQVVAETTVSAEHDRAGNRAFRRLFRYISGANANNRKIPMTAPVGQHLPDNAVSTTNTMDATNWVVTFMMPAEMTLESTPAPSSNDVQIRSVPPRRMAVIRYSGTWSTERFEAHRQKLRQWMASKGLTPIGPAEWARYNSPMRPWFLRRNEVLIPISDK